MPSAIVLADTVITQNDSKVRLVYEGTTVGTKTITVPEVTARMVTDNTTAYNNDTSTFIANTLASGAIIERGSNANGSYVKYADGTLICWNSYDQSVATTTVLGSVFIGNGSAVSYPMAFIVEPATTVRIWSTATTPVFGGGRPVSSSNAGIGFQAISAISGTYNTTFRYIAVGRWK